MKVFDIYRLFFGGNIFEAGPEDVSHETASRSLPIGANKDYPFVSSFAEFVRRREIDQDRVFAFLAGLERDRRLPFE